MLELKQKDALHSGARDHEAFPEAKAIRHVHLPPSPPLHEPRLQVPRSCWCRSCQPRSSRCRRSSWRFSLRRRGWRTHITHGGSSTSSGRLAVPDSNQPDSVIYSRGERSVLHTDVSKWCEWSNTSRTRTPKRRLNLKRNGTLRCHSYVHRSRSQHLLAFFGCESRGRCWRVREPLHSGCLCRCYLLSRVCAMAPSTLAMGPIISS